MIQDIGPKHLDNQYREKKAECTDYVMFFCERKILCGKDEAHTDEVQF